MPFALMHVPTLNKILRLVAVATLASGLATSAASAAMVSKQIDRHLCKTVHGGRFVDIPGFPGEQIDRRLLPDIRWMKRHFLIFITDGYSMDPVHAENGEHPLGLATDIVPNKAKGGTWGEIGDLAHLAEPEQDAPIPPWRWVGWNGDPGHGRGDHLHLSWMHSPSEPGHPARVVYTRKCPATPDDTSKSSSGSSTGGTSPGSLPYSGGISAKAFGELAPPLPDY
ncbi:MAG TPA: hypothetical protein VE662_03295 [Solirubrobacterales bacterium]|nr:hypothetical protein [Solirubrobacterales bacterium]